VPEPHGRGRVGHYVAALGAIALIGSLWLDWYGLDLPPLIRDLFAGTSTGWEAFSSADVVLLSCGLAVLALTALALATNAAARVGLVTALIGSVATGLVIVKIFDQPGPDQLIGVQEGAYVALVGSIAIVLGGLAANR
jgi:hypothetical protein